MIKPREFTAEQIHRNRYAIAVTVTLAATMELLDSSIVNVATPQIMGNLGATLEEVTWVSTAYIVANVIVLPISGWLSSFFGRRNYFMGSIAIFTLASFFCGSARSLEGLVFWRIVQGLGGGGLISTAQSTLYEAFPAKEIGAGVAIFGLGIMVGPTLGPTLGGYITYQSSWPWIFYINLPLGLAALFLSNIYVPDSRFKKAAAAIDWQGILLLAIGVGALQVLLERGDKLQWFESGEIRAYAGASFSAMFAFVVHEFRTKSPVVDLSILKDPQFFASIIFSFLLGVALYSTLFYVPLYLQNLLGYDTFQAGMEMLPGAIASGIAMAVVGKLTQKVSMDMRILVVLGICIFFVSMKLHGTFTTQSGESDLFLPLVLRGLGLGMVFVPLNSLAMARVAPDKIANATGLYLLVRQLGGSVGIAVAATQFTTLQETYKAELSLHVSPLLWTTKTALTALENKLLGRGMTASQVEKAAYMILDGRLTTQAGMLAFEHMFVSFSYVLVAAAPLLLLMTTVRDVAHVGGEH